MAFLAGVAILGVIGLVGALLAWLLRPTAVVKPKMATSGEPAPLQQTEEVGEAGAAVAPAPDRPLRTHPLYKRIAVLSGQVNAMRLAEVKEALQKRSLASRWAWARLHTVGHGNLLWDEHERVEFVVIDLLVLIGNISDACNQSAHEGEQ